MSRKTDGGNLHDKLQGAFIHYVRPSSRRRAYARRQRELHTKRFLRSENGKAHRRRRIQTLRAEEMDAYMRS